MGTSKTPINVVFDTGSDWLVIPDKTCDNCKGDTFDTSVSGTVVNQTLSYKTFGYAYFDGITYKD